MVSLSASGAADKALRPQAATASGKWIAKAVFQVRFNHLAAGANCAGSKVEIIYPLTKTHILWRFPQAQKVLLHDNPNNMTVYHPVYVEQVTLVLVHERQAGAGAAIPGDRSRTSADERAVISALGQVVIHEKVMPMGAHQADQRLARVL